ncbi:MAG TPA: HdeD family acid-resistance protein [Candidatus Limnocylindrales bacterium]
MTTNASAISTTDTDLPWWLYIVQGIALLVLGVLALSAPGATLVVLVQLVGIYWLVSGIVTLVGLVGDRTAWGWKLFAGIVGVLAGIAIVAHPLWASVLVPTTLVLVIGIFGIVNGAMMIFASFGRRRWTGVILGIFGVFLGLILVANPVIGAATLPFVIGAFALVGGVMSIGTAFYERRRDRNALVATAGAAAVPAPVQPSAVAADEEPGASPSGS